MSFLNRQEKLEKEVRLLKEQSLKNARKNVKVAKFILNWSALRKEQNELEKEMGELNKRIEHIRERLGLISEIKGIARKDCVLEAVKKLESYREERL